MRKGVILLLAAGCGSPTQLVVLVDSDFEVPAELAAIQTIITDEEGESAGAEFFDLSRFAVPMSFGVEGGELADEQVRILIQGLTPRDELLVERTALVGFVEGEKRLLPIFLARTCVASNCGGDQTCTENGCAPVLVDVEDLMEIEPGGEVDFPRPSKDGGTSDSGTPDSGTPDSGVDSGIAPDGGQRDAGDSGTVTSCADENDCSGDEACVEANGADCTGGACECKATCQALTPVPTCPVDQECLYRLELDGVCLDRDIHSGFNFRAPCSSQNDCDGFENWYCRQIAEPNPGECTSLCLDNVYCDQRVPGTFCDFSVFGFQPYGECLEPPPPIGDVGFACTVDAGCQSGSCLLDISMCSSSCTGLTACPSNSICGITLDGTDAWCVLTCFSDVDCLDNPSFVCRTDFGFDPGGVCFYGCQNGDYPCGPGLVCDGMTGHCI